MKFKLFVSVVVFFVSVQVVHAALLYVDDDDATCGGNSPCYGTIQDAIDAAGNGDEIFINPGSYDGTWSIENVDGLTITGHSTSTAIIKPSSTLTWSVGDSAFNNRKTAIRVASSTNITIQHLTLDMDLVKGNNIAGILYWDTSGVISENHFINNVLPDTTAQHEIGLYLRAPSYTDDDRAQIEVSNNYFNAFGRTSVLTHDFIEATIEGNYVLKTDDFGYGIEMGSDSTGVIRNNTVIGFDALSKDGVWSSGGIFVVNAYSPDILSPGITKNVTIESNTVLNNRYGIIVGNQNQTCGSVSGVCAGAVHIVATVTNNLVKDNGYGITIADANRTDGSSATLISSGNQLIDNTEYGYFFDNRSGDGDITAEITGETVSGSEYGMVALGDWGSARHNEIFDIEVHDSTFTGTGVADSFGVLFYTPFKGNFVMRGVSVDNYETGIYVHEDVDLANNTIEIRRNFFTNYKTSVLSEAAEELSVIENWWGTANRSEIFPSAVGLVNFNPWCTVDTCAEKYADESQGGLAGLLTGDQIFSVPVDDDIFSAPYFSTISHPVLVETHLPSVGTSSISFIQGTEISRADLANLSFSQVVATTTATSTISGLDGVEVVGAFQWGLPGITLSNTQAATITIPVPATWETQKLAVVRSPFDNGPWTNSGIASSTCTVAGGECAFDASLASFYVVGSSEPVITLVGNASVTIEQNATYNDAGATAEDPLEGDLTGNIQTTNPVDTSATGTYTVTYTVTNSQGKSASVDREVIVEESQEEDGPIIISSGGSVPNEPQQPETPEPPSPPTEEPQNSDPEPITPSEEPESPESPEESDEPGILEDTEEVPTEEPEAPSSPVDPTSQIATTSTYLNFLEFIGNSPVTTALALISAISTIVAGFTAIPFRSVFYFFHIWGIRRKQHPWGTVYDSVTKRPLDPAYVQLMDLNGNEVAMSITDLDGRYGFLTKSGQYTITANKTNYRFPSSRLAGKSQDAIYGDLYFGEEISVPKDGGDIVKNIPLDPLKVDWNEVEKNRRGLYQFFSQSDIWIYYLSLSIFLIGFAFACTVAFFNPNAVNISVFVLYVFLAVVHFLGFRPRLLGHITDKDNKPMAFAAVKIKSTDTGIKISQAVADKYGRYFALVPKGNYILTIEKRIAEEEYKEVFRSKSFYAKKGLINSNFQIR